MGRWISHQQAISRSSLDQTCDLHLTVSERNRHLTGEDFCLRPKVSDLLSEQVIEAEQLCAAQEQCCNRCDLLLEKMYNELLRHLASTIEKDTDDMQDGYTPSPRVRRARHFLHVMRKHTWNCSRRCLHCHRAIKYRRYLRYS